MTRIIQLIAEEFEATGDLKFQLKKGEKYVYFKDPETGKYYQPVDGFMVVAKPGGDLNDRFVEVDAVK